MRHAGNQAFVSGGSESPSEPPPLHSTDLTLPTPPPTRHSYHFQLRVSDQYPTPVAPCARALTCLSSLTPFPAPKMPMLPMPSSHAPTELVGRTALRPRVHVHTHTYTHTHARLLPHTHTLSPAPRQRWGRPAPRMTVGTRGRPAHPAAPPSGPEERLGGGAERAGGGLGWAGGQGVKWERRREAGGVEGRVRRWYGSQSSATRSRRRGITPLHFQQNFLPHHPVRHNTSANTHTHTHTHTHTYTHVNTRTSVRQVRGVHVPHHHLRLHGTTTAAGGREARAQGVA